MAFEYGRAGTGTNCRRSPFVSLDSLGTINIGITINQMGKQNHDTEPSTKEGESLVSKEISGKDNIDSYIANALSDLSMKERDTVYHEMHGVDDDIVETDEFIFQKLNALHVEIETIKDRHSKAHAYKMAESISNEYVQDPILRLKFLRGEKFNVKKSAVRVINFFDFKLGLFGKEKLCKDITIDDLDRDDLATLKSGFMQIFPVRDRAGRAVFCLLPSYQTYKTAENMTRVMYYIVMSTLDDEDTQKKGITVIVYNVGKVEKEKFDHRTFAQGGRLMMSLPGRLCALHHCFNHSSFRFIINITLHFFPANVRARAKMHYGTHMECIYHLMTFGIPTDFLPVTMDGELKRKNHLEYIKIRKRHEENILLPRILLPTQRDVLFGRGKPFREHRGNLSFFDMLEMEMEYYESLSMKKKVLATNKILNAIRGRKGRFLRQDEIGCWVEVDEKDARAKVSNGFRTRLRIASSKLPLSAKNDQLEVVKSASPLPDPLDLESPDNAKRPRNVL